MDNLAVRVCDREKERHRQEDRDTGRQGDREKGSESVYGAVAIKRQCGLRFPEKGSSKQRRTSRTGDLRVVRTSWILRRRKDCGFRFLLHQDARQQLVVSAGSARTYANAAVALSHPTHVPRLLQQRQQQYSIKPFTLQ